MRSISKHCHTFSTTGPINKRGGRRRITGEDMKRKRCMGNFMRDYGDDVEKRKSWEWVTKRLEGFLEKIGTNTS